MKKLNFSFGESHPSTRFDSALVQHGTTIKQKVCRDLCGSVACTSSNSEASIGHVVLALPTVSIEGVCLTHGLPIDLMASQSRQPLKQSVAKLVAAIHRKLVQVFEGYLKET